MVVVQTQTPGETTSVGSLCIRIYHHAAFQSHLSPFNMSVLERDFNLASFPSCPPTSLYRESKSAAGNSPWCGGVCKESRISMDPASCNTHSSEATQHSVLKPCRDKVQSCWAESEHLPQLRHSSSCLHSISGPQLPTITVWHKSKTASKAVKITSSLQHFPLPSKGSLNELVSSVQALHVWLLVRHSCAEVGGSCLLPAPLCWLEGMSGLLQVPQRHAVTFQTKPSHVSQYSTAVGLAQAPCGGASPARVLCSALRDSALPGHLGVPWTSLGPWALLGVTAVFSVPCTSVAPSRISNGLAGCERCFHPD